MLQVKNQLDSYLLAAAVSAVSLILSKSHSKKKNSWWGSRQIKFGMLNDCWPVPPHCSAGAGETRVLDGGSTAGTLAGAAATRILDGSKLAQPSGSAVAGAAATVCLTPVSLSAGHPGPAAQQAPGSRRGPELQHQESGECKLCI